MPAKVDKDPREQHILEAEASASEFEKSLQALAKKYPEAVQAIAQLWAAHYLVASHRRLGRLMVKWAKGGGHASPTR